MAASGFDSADEKTRQRSLTNHVGIALLTFVLPALGGMFAYQVMNDKQTLSKLPPFFTELANLVRPEIPIPTLQVPKPETALVSTVEFVVRRNDTLDRIFRQLKLDVDDLAIIRALPNVKHALDKLKPGDPITFTKDKEGDLQSLSRQVNDTTQLSIVREGDDFKAEIITTPLTPVVSSVNGTVTDSLFASAKRAGLSADLIMRMVNDIFGWDIDFALDIRKGDHFNIIYERLYRDKTYVGDGRILAAEFVNDGHVYRAIRYESSDGKIKNYFTPEGRGMYKQFLRAPLDFTRISSGFSLARFHPILNRIRAHKGIDYAAGTGTPIKAAGDGRIDFQGIQNGYGNVVIVDHGSKISTLYGHMSRFASGLRKGSQVKQGQIIGYVGMTGAATGPHLHYEYRINNIQKDPRSISVALPNTGPIPPTLLAEFHRQRDQLLTQLDQSRQRAIAVTPTRNKAR